MANAKLQRKIVDWTFLFAFYTIHGESLKPRPRKMTVFQKIASKIKIHGRWDIDSR